MTEKKRRRPRARSSIEVHESRELIEFDLSIGKSLRETARKFSVSKSALSRHFARMPDYLKATNLGALLEPGRDLAELRDTEAKSLIAIMSNQKARMLAIQDRALELGETAIAIKASGIIKEWTELIARFVGQLAVHSKVSQVSVILSPAYMKLRNVVTDVMLRAPPELLADFTAAMERLEREELGQATASTVTLIEHQAA
jgi:hypothetical protein